MAEKRITVRLRRRRFWWVYLLLIPLLYIMVEPSNAERYETYIGLLIASVVLSELFLYPYVEKMIRLEITPQGLTHRNALLQEFEIPMNEIVGPDPMPLGLFTKYSCHGKAMPEHNVLYYSFMENAEEATDYLSKHAGKRPKA